jgi:hypothetical protein
LISHNGLTVFVNRTRDGYSLKSTERRENGSWVTAGVMELSESDFKNWVSLLFAL